MQRLCLSCQGVTHQQWYLFNDFLIEPVDKVSAWGAAGSAPASRRAAVPGGVSCWMWEQDAALAPPSPQCEAVQFDMSWKVPAILYYARRNLNAKYNLVSECLGGSGRVASDTGSQLIALPLFLQSRTPSKPACCWRRPRWLASSASVTPRSSP